MTASTIHPERSSGRVWIDRLEPEHRLITGRPYNILKRAFDLIVVVSTLPVWLPVMAVCAAMIKLDDPSAPVLFTQRRAGLGGVPIKMCKFRTMVPNADSMVEELEHLNELEFPDFKITNDPRITRPGRFLRRTSLDELPQLWDVLLGRLSLVGPRPTVFFTDDYALWQTERLDVKPGITGLWQLYGRALTNMDDRTRLDIAYVQHRSLWFDIQVLIRTVPAVLMQRGAK